VEEEYIARLKQAVLEYDMEGVAALAQKGLDHGLNPLRGIEEGLAAGIREVGERFGAGELFLPELVMAAETLRAGVAILQPRIPKNSGARKARKVLLATVQDDIHEIGKNLVATMLTAGGYEVVDLGVNQTAEEILAKAEEADADVVGVSALMTTSMPRMRELLHLADDRKLRDRMRFIVGGAPVTDEFSQKIGSDGTAPDAAEAVHLVRRLLDGASGGGSR
jgi:corrinoid protein of di/trimethylamine methyltransferase